MILSIVTGTFNRLSSLQALIDSIRSNLFIGLDYEIILVDGGSTDGTLEWVNDLPEDWHVSVIEQGELLGAIAAFDAGAKVARGKYVLLANDDVTFHPGSIWPAILHLETHPDCGAVAFADNRPLPHYPSTRHKVQVVPTNTGQYIPYAQVGLFRKWLGDLCGWWGSDDPAFDGYTYGGDNYLSARIWEYGYTIEQVDGCMVDDTVLPDMLRSFNANAEREKGESAYHAMWPNGIEIGRYEKPAQQDKRMARILYLPIYEPRGPEDPARIAQKAQKRGLREALAAKYLVYEIDYLAIPEDKLEGALTNALTHYQPDLVLTQVQGHRPLTVQMMAHLRAVFPRPVWVNWNGDYWPENLTSPAMLDLLRYWDVQTTVNASVLEIYARHSIPAAYWQIGYEATPDYRHSHEWDAVFLANNYSDARQELGLYLKTECRAKIGLWGENWGHLGQGMTTLYDFAAGAAIYSSAKIAISDNQFPDAYGYVSNRLFQALAAGGCLVLQQYVEGLEELTGLKNGTHYVTWKDIGELEHWLVYYLGPQHEKERKAIAKAGTKFVREDHSFAARVEELRTRILPMARRQPVEHIYLRYNGRSPIGAGGVMGLQGRHYIHNGADRLLAVDPLDADWICGKYPFERASVGRSRLEV